MANERWTVLAPNKKSPSSRGFHLSQEITRNQRAMAQQQDIEQQQGIAQQQELITYQQNNPMSLGCFCQRSLLL